jgi:integrase
LIDATVEMLDINARIIVTPRGKTTQKTGRPRVIYLTLWAAVVIARRTAGKLPGDLIFHTERGKPWKRDTIADRVREARDWADLGEHVMAYGLRLYCVPRSFWRGFPSPW